MSAARPPASSGEKTRKIAAAVLLSQWFLLLAFASSERLHHAVCGSDQQPHHDCAFVAVAKSQVLVGGEIVAVPVRVLSLAFAPPPFEASFCPISDLRLMPERGPPSDVVPA